MSERQAALVQALFQDQAVHPGFAPADQVGLVEIEDAVEASHVEHELPRARREGPANARGSAHWGDRHTVGRRPTQDGGHLLAPGRPSDQDLGTLQAKAAISELDRSNVKIGQKTSMTFDAVPSLTLTGKVISIDAVGTNTQNVVTYNVVIAFDTLDKRLSPGMTPAAAITTQVRTHVLTVPRAAVKSDSSGTYVLVLPSGATTAQRVTVATGVSTDTDTEITSGLKEGDVVVTQSITAGSTGSTTGSTRTGGGLGILGGGAGRAVRGGN